MVRSGLGWFSYRTVDCYCYPLLLEQRSQTSREFQSWEAGVALHLSPCFLVRGAGVLEKGHEDDMVGRELGWKLIV